MSKRLAVWAAVLAIVLVAPQARAKDWSLSFSGGMAAPVSDFKDNAKTGYVGGLAADFTAKPNVAVGLDGSFISNKASDTNADQTAKAEILQGGGHVKYTFPMASESNLAPYLIGGLGAYNVKAKSDIIEDVSKTKFGARGGIGLMYKTSPKIGIGIESDYNWINTDNTSTQYVGVRAGITVAMGTPAAK